MVKWLSLTTRNMAKLNVINIKVGSNHGIIFYKRKLIMKDENIFCKLFKLHGFCNLSNLQF